MAADRAQNKSFKGQFQGYFKWAHNALHVKE